MKIKAFASVALIGSMLLAMTGCGTKVNYIEKKEFKKILEDELDLEKNEDYYERDYENDGETIAAYYNEVRIGGVWYDDEDDAYDEFEDAYEMISEVIEEGDFKGESKLDFQDTMGYVLVDGKVDGEYGYGGYFFCDDMLIEVFTSSKKDRDIEDVNMVLDLLGLPTL